MGEITGFKLMNGSELIAELVEETDMHYVVENALFWDLVALDDQGKKYDVQFIPISAGAKPVPGSEHLAANIKLPKVAVLFPYDIRDEIVQRYRKLISPIVLVNSSGIVQ